MKPKENPRSVQLGGNMKVKYLKSPFGKRH